MQDIYDPLKEYIKVFHGRFKEITEATFSELTKEAQVDIDENRATCCRLYIMENNVDDTKRNIKHWTILCILLWLGVAGIAIYFYQSYEDMPMQEIGILCAIAIAMLSLLFCKVYPQLRQLKSERDNMEEKIMQLEKKAWDQMELLNSLYDWDILPRMMSKTVPKLEFDPYFTTQRLADLRMSYNWDDTFNEERSVLYSLSGLINGNPFVICRTRKMEMGVKKYTGTKTIYWTTQEMGADGKMHSVQHSQVLTATVTAPYPEYYEKTWLIYGNTAAPDLTFYRQQSGLAGKEGSLSFKLKKRALHKKARNLDSDDFAMLTNEDFEVAFDTSNRNSNQQFSLLFTPLAQESMMNLLKDYAVGYGDDFDFDKNKMINTIIANHLQDLVLDMNPKQYHDFDYVRAKKKFYAINAKYFKAIYFGLAPLLCVPLYQQLRPRHDIYGNEMQRRSAFWEHEALANFWGQEHFQHSQCVTNCILKTKQINSQDENATIEVTAYGYRTEQRLSYISVMGNDGNCHDVPVSWEEYLPVQGNGYIYMKEDNDCKEGGITHQERLSHIADLLKKNNLSLYRKHIASRISS